MFSLENLFDFKAPLSLQGRLQMKSRSLAFLGVRGKSINHAFRSGDARVEGAGGGGNGVPY